MSISTLRIPKGSLVFVTGATGLIGSATTEELVKQGYKVRAATRQATRAGAFVTKLEKLYGQGALEIVEIADLTAPGAYTQALQGVAGVVHLATDVSFSADVDKVLDTAINATVGLLQQAAKIPSIQSVVITSSRVAAYTPKYGPDMHISLEDYTDYFTDLARSTPDDAPEKGFLTYAASKVEAERAAWRYWQNEKPQYAFNTVLPDYVAGPIANPAAGTYSTSTWLTELFEGETNGLAVLVANPPALLVDVRDVALVHVGALLSSEVNGQRLWASGHPYDLNSLLKIWREAYPDGKTIPADFDFPAAPKQIIDNRASTRLIQEFAGRDWISLEQTVLDNVKRPAGKAEAI